MSTSTLPRIREAQKRAEDSRYYMLRANRQMTTLALNRIQDQLESERVDFNARVKQESLDLKMELLRRAEEEKAVLKADEDMLFDVNVKIAKRRKKRADEQQQQRDRKKEIKRRVQEKQKDRRFERKAIPEESTTETPTEETSGGGHRLSLFPDLAPKKLPNDLDLYMPRMVAHEKREPRIKLDRDLIFPNARKPTLYKQLMSQNFKREVSRINEKSLRKLREKYRMLAAEEETKRQQEAMEETTDTPYISSVAHMMYNVAEDSRQSHLNRILRQVADTRETLRLTAPRMPLSDRLKQSLEECVRRRKKRRRREAKGKERTSEALLRSGGPEAASKAEEASTEKTAGGGESSTPATAAEVVKTEAEATKKEEKTEAVTAEKEKTKAETSEKEEKTEAVTAEKEKTKAEAAENEKPSEGDNQRDELPEEEEPATVLKSILSRKTDKADEQVDSKSEEKIWRLPASSGRTRSEDSAMKRVTLKGPNLTPIQSTEVSPATTREPTLVPQEDEAPMDVPPHLA